MLAAEYWSAKAKTGYAPNWFSLCADEITRRITGQTALPATRWLMQRTLPAVPASSMLEIGCLSGKKLRSFLDEGWIKRGVGIDVAAGAVEAGRRIPRASLRFDVMDLNAPRPLGERFEVIHANGVLHHIANLEACARWITEHLEPNGVLIASEFTGPVRYRYSQHEVDLINEGVAMLPVELRETFDPASLKPKLDADPSESVRSRDIVPVLQAAGLQIEERRYGGNILQRALGRHFFAHFNPSFDSHTLALARLVRFDHDVMLSEPSHHAVLVGRHYISSNTTHAAASSVVGVREACEV